MRALLEGAGDLSLDDIKFLKHQVLTYMCKDAITKKMGGLSSGATKKAIRRFKAEIVEKLRLYLPKQCYVNVYR